MKETEKNGCPCCGSNERTVIQGKSDSGWGSLFIRKCGSVDLDLCLNCGCVYMNESRLQSIKKQMEGRQ